MQVARPAAAAGSGPSQTLAPNSLGPLSGFARSSCAGAGFRRLVSVHDARSDSDVPANSPTWLEGEPQEVGGVAAETMSEDVVAAPSVST